MKDTNTYKKLKKLKTNNYPEHLIVHHSGGTDLVPLADTSHHTAKIMEEWHIGKGWDGLGYHYVIHKDGEVWRGRPEHRNGAHARGYNTKSIGICLSGNFDATLPTKAQETALKDLLLKTSAKYDIPYDKIIPHRNVANKTCYGNKLSESWARELLEKEVRHDCPLALKDADWNETISHLIELYKNK